MSLNQSRDEPTFEEAKTRTPKKKISNYLPISLLKDMSFEDDNESDNEDIFEVESPSKKRKPMNKSNFKRRRSSSLDIGIISSIPHKVNHVKFAEAEKDKPHYYIMNRNDYNTLNNNNNNNNNNSSNHISFTNQHNLNSSSNNNNNNHNINTINAYSFAQPKESNLIYIVSNQQSSMQIQPNTNNKTQQIKPRKKRSENITQRQKNNSPFPSSEQIYHPVKKYSNTLIKRELNQDILNTNQTFKEFLSNHSERLSSIIRSLAGSRFLQKMLDQITSKDIAEIFNILNGENNIITTICDNYGNYFMKKLILKCNHEQRMFLYDKLKGKFITIANDLSGTHCLQSLIDSIEMKDEETLLKQCVINNLLDLSCSNNATHVIQKIISVLKEPKRQYINTFVLNHFIILSTNVNGICVIKTFISYNEDEQIKAIVLSNLEANCYEITQDLYGNYVIQHALEYYNYYQCINIITMICSNILFFSNQKFASNVVDKVLMIIQKNNYPFFKQVISSLFLNQINFVELLRNKFGLFVLINILKLLSLEDKVIIKAFLIQNIMFNDNEDKGKFSKVLAHCK